LSELLVRMEQIEKSFPGVQALSGCEFELRRGEVHALVGENGAGKSTMMKILSGVCQRDGGTLLYKGREVNFPNPKAAQEAGISMIHQELSLIPDLTVAQNIFIGREPRLKFPLFTSDAEINREARKLLGELGVDIDPRTVVSRLTVAIQQMVEIAKALSFQSEVLIMDEPTAALTDSEIRELFIVIDNLRRAGKGVIYISHRMDELKRIADRITVMRDGRYIGTLPAAEAEIGQIISMMVGREWNAQERRRQPAASGRGEVPALEVRNLSRGNVLKNISFSLHRGEIVGVAGLMGAGRTELARAVFGADPHDGGEIRVNGRKVAIRSPHEAVRHGIAYLSEDRKRYGCVTDLPVAANIGLPSCRRFSRYSFWVNDRAMEEAAAGMVERLRIKTPGIHQVVKFLSGGNQQKVVIGKWLVRNCDILIFDEPTRGIDVGAKNEIYKLMEELAEQGKAILMISSELPEILRLSHRILVMREGEMTAELDGASADQETIMKYATLSPAFGPAEQEEGKG